MLARRDPFQTFIGQFVKKAALDVVARLPMQHAGLAEAQVQALACTRDGHIHQAALFFHAVGVAQALLVREEAFFNAGDEHGVKLQALGRMHRHQLHGVLASLRLVVARFKRGMGQKRRQGRHDFTGFSVGCCVD